MWVLQAGGLANALGNGAVMPFTVIYLHSVRGIPLGTSGLVVAAGGLASLAAGLPAGSLVDRVGARAATVGALGVMAVAFAGFPLIREAWHAFLLSALAGAGQGAFRPALLSLIAALAPQPRRHAAFALQRVTANLGIGLGGVTGGLIATTAHPRSFSVLFLANAASFVVFIASLAFVPSPEQVEAARRGGGYLEIMRDRVFARVNLLNAVLMTGGIAQFFVLPVYAKSHGVSERGIGLIFLANTLLIVVAQLPVAQALEGRRRMPALALVGVLWGAGWLVVLAGGSWFRGAEAAAVMAFAVAVFGLGECLYGAVLGPLVADLAQPESLGRYLGASSTSNQLAFTAGPAIGGFLLASRRRRSGSGPRPCASWRGPAPSGSSTGCRLPHAGRRPSLCSSRRPTWADGPVQGVQRRCEDARHARLHECSEMFPERQPSYRGEGNFR